MHEAEGCRGMIGTIHLSDRSYRKFALQMCGFGVVLLLLPGPAWAGAGVLARLGKSVRRIIAPFRSDPFIQNKMRPCGSGSGNCFLPDTSLPSNTASRFDRDPNVKDESRIVFLELRTAHGGPMVHHWVETEISTGKVTLGFGPATLPFIDAGQISLRDAWGDNERITGMHPVPPLALPPLNYRYARLPGEGRTVGKPIELTLAQSEALVQGIRHQKFIGPYVPLFHDCRTFACSVQAAAAGRSSLPCYLLFKGYW